MWDDQCPVDIYISGVGQEFFYKNFDGNKCSFKAYQFSVSSENNHRKKKNKIQLIQPEIICQTTFVFL